MLDSFSILEAMEGIDGKKVHAVGTALGYTNADAGHSHKKLWRTLLIAAVIASLMGVTAYASGWFGLSTRVQVAEPLVTASPMETEDVREPGGFMSSNGYADSPAAQAHKEWWEFYFSYVDSHSDTLFEGEDWYPDDEELKAYALVYSTYNQEMLDKLLEIRDKYQVALHTEERLMPTSSMFHKVTGTSSFILSDDVDTANAEYHVYEDGSFRITAAIDNDWSNAITISRGYKNVLDPVINYIYDVDKFQEDVYVTSQGTQVNIASNGNECYVFYDTEDYIVTISASFGDPKALAEMFDYDAMCSGETDLSLLTAKSKEVKAKDGLLTYEQFMETDEYKAATEFSAAYEDIAYQIELAKAKYAIPGLYYYYGNFPADEPEINQLAEDILTKYPLVLPASGEAIMFDNVLPKKYISSPLSSSDEGYKLREAVENPEEYSLKILGMEPFITDEDSYIHTAISWDNGCWQAYIYYAHGGFDINYIPKGCFYPILQAPEGTGSSYVYNTACGEQVSIYSYYTTCTCGYAVYETDNAYVVLKFPGGLDFDYYFQGACDVVDFTKFK